MVLSLHSARPALFCRRVEQILAVHSLVLGRPQPVYVAKRLPAVAVEELDRPDRRPARRDAEAPLQEVVDGAGCESERVNGGMTSKPMKTRSYVSMPAPGA
ncbi:hypothetical protein AB0F11_24820 [Streptomyces sp. NPDC032472]|uniref:hypothetical protein n=1 Tax=Streptomyces sp. NPDC032472 TaxID=3155018 RepID=UPI0033E62733